MTVPGPAALVLARARSGDVAGAITLGEETLARGEGDAALAMFLGMLCGRAGDLARGLEHLRSAVAKAPGEAMPRVELARALLSSGANEEAADTARPLAEPHSPRGREMQRVLALAHARMGEHAEAAALFAPLVAADRADFESWRGLGLARLALGDAAGAVTALGEATSLRPRIAGCWTDLARAHAAAQAPGQALSAAEQGALLAPEDAGAQIELARAQTGVRRFAEAEATRRTARALAGGDPDLLCAIADTALVAKAPAEAEADYRSAITVRADHEAAWRGLASVLERMNRASELGALVDLGIAAGVPRQAMALATARALRSQGKLDEADGTLAAMPANGPDEIARFQLAGDIADRRGDVDAAFAAFSRANAIQAERTEGSARHAADYRANFAGLTAFVTPQWYARWPARSVADDRRSPLFVFGFPRSGTTLLDTLLGGHADTVVLEEEPTVDRISEAAGPIERLLDMGDAEIARLRDVYFAEVARVGGDVAGRLIVDKQPLALGSTPLLHRLFPDARFVFVERHPCDVVLSCFLMSAQMDTKVANFFDFTSTALLYDQVLGYWRRCTDVLAIDTLAVRYEGLIASPETEMRRLAAFAGLDWDERLLSNQANAASRGYIGSPSYAQVAEPIYTRARGRWLRYRQHMAPVLPILGPWIERLGYSDPDA